MHAILVRNVLQPLLAKRHGSKHLEYAKILQRSQYDPFEVIEHRQWLALQALLQHAATTVPYYQRLFLEMRLVPQDFRSIEDLQWLPILTKQQIREAKDDLISSRFQKSDLFRKTTSGSTGVPLEIYVNRFAKDWKAACTLRSDEWSGWRRGERIAKVWGNPEYQAQGWKGKIRNRLIDRATYLDTIGMDEQRIQNFYQQLSAAPPALLFGHAHSLYLFADFCLNQSKGKIRPKGIISTAMPLHAFQRQRIEKAFQCKVTNRYGCEEVSLIASQCEQNDVMHLNADSLLAEIVPLHPFDPTTGHLILTDLINYGMPLLRYQVGDVVTKSTQPCRCGRQLPSFSNIEGREADYVKTPKGKWISGISLTENFATKVPGIAQLQIIQHQLNQLELKIVAETTFGPESLLKIDQLLLQLFDAPMQKIITIVDAIPQERSGKYRFCISKLKQPDSTPQNSQKFP